MNDMLQAPFLKEMCDIIGNMYRLGWDERNGGNVSLLLDEAEVAPYLSPGGERRAYPIGLCASPLAGRYLLLTGSGKYFKNVPGDPARNLGLIRITPDGLSYEILWGFLEGGRPTSELPTHLLNHIARLEADPAHRVVMHCHPANVLAMTYIHELEDRAFSRTLWQMSTECVVVFPEGVRVLPWMLCGTVEIGRETAKKIADCRVVLWAHHGIFAAGASLDETFGLIETVEKSAEIFIKTRGCPVLQTIRDSELQRLADAFGVRVQPGYLEA